MPMEAFNIIPGLQKYFSDIYMQPQTPPKIGPFLIFFSVLNLTMDETKVKYFCLFKKYFCID